MRYKILKKEILTYFANIIDVYGQGSSTPTKKGVDGFEVQFLIAIDNKTYTVIFQSEERSCNMTAWNGYEMTNAGVFGVESDESEKLRDDEKDGQEILSELNILAESYCKEFLEGEI